MLLVGFRLSGLEAALVVVEVSLRFCVFPRGDVCACASFPLALVAVSGGLLRKGLVFAVRKWLRPFRLPLDLIRFPLAGDNFLANWIERFHSRIK